MNDVDRRLWVLNDEGLYNWYRGYRQSISTFIQENRVEITECINKALGR